jgi:hypothetical protein
MSKAFVRRKEYKRAVRQKAANGLVNNEQGIFVPSNQINATTAQHVLAGYKVGAYQKRNRA